MTARNVERTGQRYVSRLSTIARRIEGVRHCDVDLVQLCPRCLRPQLFAEVKRKSVGDREWAYTREYARFYGHSCIAILVVETMTDNGVKVYHSDTNEIREIVWGGGEEYLESVLNYARDIHACW